MDKPRHPLVIRPWKIQQTKRNKASLPPLGAVQNRLQSDSNERENNAFDSKHRKKVPK